MKKLLCFNAFKMAMVLSAVIPLGLNAQSDSSDKRSLKEFYGRPSNWRPYDQTGINKFEDKKSDSIPFEGLRIRFGAGFTQQWQSLSAENTAIDNQGSGLNKVYPLESGFMTAQANLNTDVQLADGIRLNVTTYLSSRHHNEAWVKGGYIQFDKLPFKGKFWSNLMNVTTIKVGHMEVNYGDQHYRRSDGGQTLYNPFMDNYIMDQFATEIGGEVILQKKGFFGVLSLTNGMIKGNVDSAIKGVSNGVVVDDNQSKQPSVILKGGWDKQINEKLRVRFSGSYYHNGSNAGSGLTLYGGDRTGSNYQNVMEKWKTTSYNAEKSFGKDQAVYDTTAQSSTAIAFSGRFNPGFSKKIDAVMLNAFVKYGGLEFFGTYETAKGRAKTEVDERTADQLAGELVYRFGKNENLFVGARYNTLSARLTDTKTIKYTEDIKIDRTAFSAGWFVTRNILLKGEYVDQKYMDFPTADYRNGGKFNGVVIEAVVGF